MSRFTRLAGVVIAATFLSTMVGCASLYQASAKIPGLDRIFYDESKADVGPVKNQSGEVVVGTASEASTEETPVSETTPATEVTPVIEQMPVAKPITSRLSGVVTLLAAAGELDPTGLIVRLTPLEGQKLHADTSATLVDLDMQDKTYLPGQMVVRKGDAVNFINKDDIQHNVFSSSGGNAFDLGTFGGGLQRAVRLNEEGVVKVYCNIHPNMATYIAVDDKSRSQIIDNSNGQFAFNNLPEGRYQLTVWSIRGEKSQEVLLEAGESAQLVIRFDTSNYTPVEQHTNKFGEAYEKQDKATLLGDFF